MNAETESAAAKSKSERSSKTRKSAARPARATSKTEKLVCRYCGSDDLAPSFKKRGDARCRACFKQRYGAAAREKQTPGTRKAKATK